jgi:hypothetical protein
MTDAIEVHAAFMTNGVGADDVFWKALSYCKACITNASTGVGAASDGWSKHLSAIKSTLSEIEICIENKWVRDRSWKRSSRTSPPAAQGCVTRLSIEGSSLAGGLGGAAGGIAIGAAGSGGGEMMGDYLYRQTSP